MEEINDNELKEAMANSVQQRIESLRKDEADITSALENESKNKLSRNDTYIETQYKEDLNKVQSELSAVLSDNEMFNQAVEQMVNINNNIENINTVLKDLNDERTDILKEIEKVQNNLEYKNGNFEKITELKEHQADLEKIEQEIKEKQSILSSYNGQIDNAKSTVQSYIEKYKINISIEKKPQTQLQQNQVSMSEEIAKLQEELKKSSDRITEYKKAGREDMIAQEMNERQKILNKINELNKSDKTSTQQNQASMSEEIAKLQDELKKSSDRIADYKKAGREDMIAQEMSERQQILNKINELNKTSMQQFVSTSKPIEGGRTEGMLTEEEKNNGFEELVNSEYMKSLNDAYKNELELVSDEKNGIDNSSKKIAIEIGRSGKITIGNNTYKISKDVINEGMHLNDLSIDELKEYFEKSLNTNNEDLIIPLAQSVKTGLMDMCVYKSIETLDIDEKERYDLLKKYAINIKLMAEGDKISEEDKMQIDYNMKDLSKVSLWSRIFGKEINEQQKAEMMNIAMLGERWGVSKIIGQFKYSILAKFLNLGKKTAKFPLQNIDEIHEVANAYDKSRYSKVVKDGQTGIEKKDDKEFIESLKNHIENDTNGLSKNQKEELSELVKDQDNIDLDHDDDSDR